MAEDDLNFDDLREGYDYYIENEMLKRYVPDIPEGVEFYICPQSMCTAEPFNPYTSVYTQLKCMTLCSYDFGPLEGDANQFDIRRPEEFDYIAWIRSVLEASLGTLEDILNSPSHYAPDEDGWEMPARVQIEIFRTNYREWYESWMRRGAPIQIDLGTVDRYNGHGVRKQFREAYPLDPNLTASKRK